VNQAPEIVAGVPGAILRGASRLVPRLRRAEWLSEWQAELWYVQLADTRNSGRKQQTSGALRFALGALRDAALLCRDALWLGVYERRWLRSPVNCLLALAGFAALLAWSWLRVGGFHAANIDDGASRGIIVGYFWSLALAMIVLPANRSLLLAEYPLAAGGVAQLGALRRRSFLGVKLLLIVPIVFFALTDLANLIGLASAQSQAVVDAMQGCTLGPLAALTYAAAFRWALLDQHHRCPACLRRLSDPVRIGLSGQTIVNPRATDYFCARGHGLMRFPDVTTTYGSPRWLDGETSQ
jgi:hypothetical protein